MGNREIGLGHFYRMQSLAQEARTRGHYVKFLSDYPADGVQWHKAQPDDPNIFFWAIRAVRPDWVIVDLPGTLPEWLFGHCAVCVIDQNCGTADLCISQGYEGKYRAPKYLIIPPIAECQQPHERCWFVWGGSMDVMGLLGDFVRYTKETALLLTTDITPVPRYPRLTQMVVKTLDRKQFFSFACQCDRACVQMGQTVWELVYLGIPCYVFSHNERGLKTALRMQEAGLVKAYPKIGIPGGEKFTEFIGQEFAPRRGVVDGLGAGRIVELLEQQNAG
jgi:hypothetical protein